MSRSAICRWRCLRLFTLVAICIASAGCTVCQNLKRTVWHEPHAYSWKHDRRRSVEVYRAWAESAWQEAALECPEMLGDNDYALGFRDGFVDYVYAGGNGEPPPVPPRHYWNVMLRSPEGKQQADSWFAGYRHGAHTARSGGYRELGTIRTSLVTAPEHFEQTSYTPQPTDAYGADLDGDESSSETVLPRRPTPSFPTLPAPRRPQIVDEPVDDRAVESITTPQLPASGVAPSNDVPAGDSTEQPEDGPFPADELLGDPFQSDSSFRPRPTRGPKTEAPGGNRGQLVIAAVHEMESANVRIATQDSEGLAKPLSRPLTMRRRGVEKPPQESEGSTLRMVAEPINGAQDNQPTIVVHLTPTPVGQGDSPVHASQSSAVDVRLTSTTETDEVRAPEINGSTIRIRTEPDHGRPTSTPLMPRRKPKFLR